MYMVFVWWLCAMCVACGNVVVCTYTYETIHQWCTGGVCACVGVWWLRVQLHLCALVPVHSERMYTCISNHTRKIQHFIR